MRHYRITDSVTTITDNGNMTLTYLEMIHHVHDMFVLPNCLCSCELGTHLEMQDVINTNMVGSFPMDFT